jgi:hypothetical protein
VTSISMPGRTEASFSPVARSASPAKNLKIWPARPASAVASASVLPSSRAQQLPELLATGEDLGADRVEHVEAALGRALGPGVARVGGRADRALGLRGVGHARTRLRRRRDPRGSR